MSTVRAGIGHMVHSMQFYPTQSHMRSEFNRSHTLITSFNSGLLIPIWKRYAYPGDTLKLDIGALARLSSQRVPFMTDLLMDVHVWCVPIRLIYDNWKKLQGEQENPGDSTDYLMPVINSADAGDNGYAFNSIFDHFDLVPGVSGYDATTAFLRSYNLTWNENYRDENVQDRVTVEKGDTDDVSNYVLLPRGKRKDYFTGALPWPQKGEDVLLPLGSTADIVGTGNALGLMAWNTNSNVGDTGVVLHGGLSQTYNTGWSGNNNGMYIQPSNIGQPVDSANASGQYIHGTSGASQGYRVGVTTEPGMSGMVADLSTARSATMSQMYMANAVQQILQIDARSGTRYIELLLGRWGVRSSDARLQRPEFLGGGTFDLNTSIVPQTSETTNTSPLATLGAYSTINGRTKTIVKSFEEHCCVFAVVSVRQAEYYYQQGLDREYSKRSRFDFYEPGLANLPEQTIKNKEIYIQADSIVGADGVTPVNEETWAYQERFSEDKTSYSRIHGYMRDTAPQSLGMWHLGVKYDSLPAYNDDFIKENVPLVKILSVTGDNVPEFLGNFWFEEHWYKEMPLFSNPSLMKF